MTRYHNTHAQTLGLMSAESGGYEGSSLELNWIRDSFLLFSFIHSFFCSSAPGHDCCILAAWGSAPGSVRVRVNICVRGCVHPLASVCTSVSTNSRRHHLQRTLSPIIQSQHNMKIIFFKEALSNRLIFFIRFTHWQFYKFSAKPSEECCSRCIKTTITSGFPAGEEFNCQDYTDTFEGKLTIMFFFPVLFVYQRVLSCA